jgi:molybdopterin-guanine dinucleotide biosynthesis protein A
MRIWGVILAGGTGRRMGGADKALLPFGGSTLIAHAIARFAPQVERLAISANGDPARFAVFDLPVLPDDVAMGPLSGVLAALDWAGRADAIVSMAVDTPFVPGDLVPRLLEGGMPAMATSGGNDHPTAALWPIALRGPLRDFLASGAKARVRDFLGAHGVVRVTFPDEIAFRNINTPADLAAAEALLP